MNSNSFQLKGWTVTLVSALLALFANSSNKLFICVATLPTLLFWILDAYYLQQERKFRRVYNDVVRFNYGNSHTEIGLFEMPINIYQGGKYSYRSAFLSKSVIGFYLSICLLLFLLWIAV